MKAISSRAFKQIQQLFEEASGIALREDKKGMVEARLRKRLIALGLDGYEAYCALLARADAAEERQQAVDLLTTNETYFFREPSHFHALSKLLEDRFARAPVRLWSAACSTGEEPYSLAMLLLDRRPTGGWDLRASDLSRSVIERARRGIYPMKRLEHMPVGYLERFCLRGRGDYAGTIRVKPEVRQSVHYFAHNLTHDVPSLGTFEVIFLRNVLIYFRDQLRQQILSAVVRHLRPRGVLFVGHSESLQGLTLPLERIDRSIYARP